MKNSKKIEDTTKVGNEVLADVMLLLRSNTELDEWYEFLAGQGETASNIACYLTEVTKFTWKIANSNKA